jgi:hypothetical protein
MPETVVARIESGLYVVRTPKPKAMPSGVVMLLRKAAIMGALRYFGGSCRYAD